MVKGATPFGAITGQLVHACHRTSREVVKVEDADIAEALGHVGFSLGKTARGDRYLIECGCGYKSTGRQTVRLAIDAGNHHLKTEIAKFRKTGLPITAIRRVAV